MLETTFTGTTHVASLARAIGNTPMFAIHLRFRGEPRTVHAKCEQLNLTGSIKDRMAFHILESAYREGLLRPGDTIVEATSGNTGISFAALGRALGHRVTVFMPDWMSRERMDLIRSYGAEVIGVSHQDGGFQGAIKMAEDRAAKDPHTFLPRQFSNEANVRAHERTTGPEILSQLRAEGIEPKAFVAGVGTGGTVMGVGRYLRAWLAGVKVHPVEPTESPTLSTGYKVGQHRVQGVSDEFVPPILHFGALDGIIQVSDGDAILMAQKLACELGLGVGISSGMNFLAALIAQDQLGKDAPVVTVFPDDNKKYLSTCLLKEEPVKPHYLSPEIQLLSIGVMRRVCSACL